MVVITTKNDQIEEYQKHLHKYVEPILQKYIDIIVKINPKVIGITLYFCNEGAHNGLYLN